ncbi:MULTISPECIES: SCP2 sterol-binding domain-containing protein [unclassified Caballeronia]|uniref:ubiquinone biosynthesis accessory factor UbiJ n=1 Tax=unclassified Caballeronia TaxID=2646786 RepID=UPI002861FD51|nr:MULTISPECIES: SCP2 sterol-binding domain-containing protein [unclassified Caballeronia]MDR5736744.1 SCP2 sterol-binding domain-containing protein [Caballeronia sp. LZ016]MDR5810775.1 SCP2 sterol-binding domain-containing protein [Caballeronia sp. LZ019]
MRSASTAFAAVVNHLLVREPWARERVKPYAGKCVRLVCGPVSIALVAQADGLFAAISEAQAPHFDVTIAVPLDALPAFLQGGQAAVMKHVRIEGDAEFATTLAKLAEHLRWDPEEDLSRVIGDAPAHRVGRIARTVQEQARRTGRNVLDSVAEYLLDERPQLVRKNALDAFNAELSRARDALARVEKRIERMEQTVQQRSTARGASARTGGESVRDSHE